MCCRTEVCVEGHKLPEGLMAEVAFIGFAIEGRLGGRVVRDGVRRGAALDAAGYRD